MLKEVRPQATRFGFLVNATNPNNLRVRMGALFAARELGIKLAIIEVKDQSELADAFGRMGPLGVEALAINPDPVLRTNANAATIANLARSHKLPTVGEGPYFVDAGGLFGLRFGFRESRQQHRRQDGDDRNHHEQLNEGEPGRARAYEVCLPARPAA